MSPQKPRFAFLGDPTGALAQAVGGDVDLQPAIASISSDTVGLLIEGATAVVDAAMIKQVLESGQVLAIANPTEACIKTLLELTGQAPGVDTPLVTYRKSISGETYDCTFASSGTGGSSCVTGSSVTCYQNTFDLEPSPGFYLLQALTVQGAPSVASLAPPLGTMAGFSSFQTAPTPIQVPPPQTDAGAVDNKDGASGTQSVSISLNGEFYVYWVNGGTTPYYVVIYHQTGTVANQQPYNSNGQDSRGWFNSQFQLQPVSLINPFTSQPFGSDAITLAGYAPASATGQIDISFQPYEMTVYAKGQAGFSNQQWTAKVESQLNYVDGQTAVWGIENQTSGISTGWTGYQTTPWNTLQQQQGKTEFWNAVLPVSGNSGAGTPTNPLAEMPDLSWGSIPFESFTIWSIGASPSTFTVPTTAHFNPPPSCLIQFEIQVSQQIALIHNQNGCEMNETHACQHTYSYGVTQLLDLGSIASQQYWGKQ